MSIINLTLSFIVKVEDDGRRKDLWRIEDVTWEREKLRTDEETDGKKDLGAGVGSDWGLLMYLWYV